MRTARLKTTHKDAWHHLTIRTIGYWDEVLLDHRMRADFLRIFSEVSSISSVEILDYAIMGNHLHVVCRPGKPLTDSALLKRMKAYYAGRPNPYADAKPGDDAFEAFKANSTDVSYMMKIAMLRMSAWYNSHGPRRRTGSIWTQRHKTAIIEGSTALWSLLQHIALNPARVGECEDPAEYPFSAYGVWMQTEKHPFEDTFMKAMQTMKPDFTGTADQALDLFIDELVPFLAPDAPQQLEYENTDQPVLVSAKNPRRTWTDGAVLGSEKFVRGQAKKLSAFKNDKKLGGGVLIDGTRIYSLRKLRFRSEIGEGSDSDPV